MKNRTAFTEEFREQIYRLVRMIPRGKVATYGQLAFLAGYPRHARMAGRALKEVPHVLHLPCHRVVNASGRCVPGWLEQAKRLRSEKVPFLPCGNVDLNRCLWDSYGERETGKPEPGEQNRQRLFTAPGKKGHPNSIRKEKRD